jgi:hypothetical protein
VGASIIVQHDKETSYRHGCQLLSIFLAGLSCDIMNKIMFDLIEPEVLNLENGKFTICCDSVHVSRCATKYNGGNGGTAERQCGLCFHVVKAISDARNTHLSAVMVGSETNCLLDALITDPDFYFCYKYRVCYCYIERNLQTT